MKETKKGSLNSIRHEIQKNHLILIVVITILLSAGSAIININANARALQQNLINTSGLITRVYSFTKNLPPSERTEYFNDLCRQLKDVDVISIVDSDNTRLYHTNNSLIGTKYDGKILELDKMDLHMFKENGPSGPQERIYSVIYDDKGNYSGFIMTIVLKTSIRLVTVRTILLFLLVTIIAIFVEVLISETFSKRIKQKLMGYEPDTFSSMFMIRNDILESIQDGIVAIDANMNVQFINGVARNLLNLTADEKVNEIKEKVFVEKILKNTLETGKAESGIQEQTQEGLALLVDCMPVKKGELTTGAVAILHDRTELTRMAEDLSGTKYLVDSMRANNHDFTNKLHVILGLIQIEQYEKAVSYIENISIIQRETLSKVMNAIDNPSFAALLVGKIARASECNVKFILRDGLRYNPGDIQLPSEALVTIVGNLIDNALDSMNMSSQSEYTTAKELIFGAFTKPGELLISVTDNGCGIPESNREKIFENGFSTKGQGRGVGLYHTKQLIESLGGKISFESQVNAGTTFMVSFKK